MHVSMASAALSEVPNIRNNPNPHQRDKCSSITTCSYDPTVQFTTDHVMKMAQHQEAPSAPGTPEGATPSLLVFLWQILQFKNIVLPVTTLKY